MPESGVAGLVVARLDGERIGEDFERYRDLARRGVGGFIVFGGEAESLRQGLRDLQQEAPRRLIVASDLEQGLGQQVRGGTVLPSALGMGSGFDPDRAEDRGLFLEAAGMVAREALAVGINVVLAPVADVATNPDNPVIGYRAFGSDPARVARMVSLWVQGLQRPSGLPPGVGGPWACAKHFPGHGDTSLDSHLELPAVSHDAERLSSVEIPPFAEAIRSGVKSVMTGHLKFPALDPEFPASISKRIVDGLLRRKLGFGGIVMTDALNMGGISREMPEEEAAVLALAAGTDILLHPSSPEDFIALLNRREKEIAPFVERSRRRLDGMLRDLPTAADAAGAGPVGGDAHRSLADRVAAKVLRVKGESPVLDGAEVCLVLDDDGEEGTAQALIEELSKDYGCLDLRKIGPGRFSDPGDLAGRATVAMVFSRVRGWKGRSGIGAELAGFIAHLAKSTRLETAVIFGMPDIDRHFPTVRSTVYAYGTGEPVERQAARLLSEKR